MTVRILHLSDLHMGHGEAWEPLPALERLIDALEPTLLLATGDLAHRGRLLELEAAGTLLRGLGLPLVAVPGNHDIPYTIPSRFTRTFDAWSAVFGATEPHHEADGLVVAGLNSARAWRQQGGAVDPAPLQRALERLAGAPAGALRVVAIHHHLAAPPWRAPTKSPLSRRDDVLQALLLGGADLVVGGHVHQASVTDRREFRALEEGSRRSIVLATAPGLGRPRPRRREEARGANVYEADAETLLVKTYAWDGEAFDEIARRAFSRR